MHFRVGLIVLVLVGCGGSSDESLSDSQDSAPLLAGRVVPQSEIVRDLRAAGFADDEIPQMVCAAKYESSYYSKAEHRNRNGSTDYGLFQINDDLWAAKCGLTVANLYDPARNARCARTVYNSGGIGSWYGYKRHVTECESFTLAP